ncbi:hypothetical protein AB0O22_16905 [Streptomyces sp. NPDC091204]|uniref:hypothetical protein n=1 Tax=Streptomyces sp. NPDC091204 TaxID=3155299 RepID=UPI00343B4610
MGDLLHLLHGRDTIECATAYERLGWPVAIGHRHRTGSGCTCQDTASKAPRVTPGAHPREAVVKPLPRGELAAAFESAPGAGVIVPCTHWDALVVAHPIGMAVMVRVDAVGLHVPYLASGHATVTLLVAPGTGELLVDCPQVEVRSGPRAWVALPPSYSVRWETAPAEDHPLPDAGAVRLHLAEVLKLASADRKRW